MGNHPPEACMAQANSQIGGTIGDGRNERVCFDLAAASAHDDTACVRILTKSGIMLWRHRLMGIITNKSFSECYARNLRPETWRWWLSECLRKHLFFVPSTGKSLLISSRGTLSAHNAVFLAESAIISLLCMAPHAMTNMSLTKVFLR